MTCINHFSHHFHPGITPKLHVPDRQGCSGVFFKFCYFFMAESFLFSFRSSQAGIFAEKAVLSANDSTKPRSTACLGPSFTGVLISFSTPE